MGCLGCRSPTQSRSRAGERRRGSSANLTWEARGYGDGSPKGCGGGARGSQAAEPSPPLTPPPHLDHLLGESVVGGQWTVRSGGM